MGPQVLTCRVAVRKTRWLLQPTFPNLAALIFLIGQKMLAVGLHLTFKRVLKAIMSDTGCWAVLVVSSGNLSVREELLRRVVRNCNFYLEYHSMDRYILCMAVQMVACLYHEHFPHRRHPYHRTFEENPGVSYRIKCCANDLLEGRA